MAKLTLCPQFVAAVFLYICSVMVITASASQQPERPFHAVPNGDSRLVMSVENAIPKDIFENLIDECLAFSDKGLNSRINNEGLMHGKQRTFWYDFRSESGPRLYVERAIEHLARTVNSDLLRDANATIIGAEWWVQKKRVGGGDHNDIGFHYDKDEGMASMKMTMRCPPISTITYLTAERGAAPTVIFNQTTVDGNVEEPPLPASGYVIYPRRNRHVSFRGSLLHGALAALASPLTPSSSPSSSSSSDLDRRVREGRVTLLINFWDVRPLQPYTIDLTESLLVDAVQPLVWRNRVERLARDLRRDQQKLQEQQDHTHRINSKTESGEEGEREEKREREGEGEREREEQGVELFPQDAPSCTHRSAAVELTVAADAEGAANTCEGGRIGSQAIQEFEIELPGVSTKLYVHLPANVSQYQFARPLFADHFASPLGQGAGRASAGYDEQAVRPPFCGEGEGEREEKEEEEEEEASAVLFVRWEPGTALSGVHALDLFDERSRNSYFASPLPKALFMHREADTASLSALLPLLLPAASKHMRALGVYLCARNVCADAMAAFGPGVSAAGLDTLPAGKAVWAVIDRGPDGPNFVYGQDKKGNSMKSSDSSGHERDIFSPGEIERFWRESLGDALGA